MRIEEQKNLTQEKLAELSEISAKHITKIEKANVTPSAYPKALEVLSNILINRKIS